MVFVAMQIREGRWQALSENVAGNVITAPPHAPH